MSNSRYLQIHWIFFKSKIAILTKISFPHACFALSNSSWKNLKIRIESIFCFSDPTTTSDSIPSTSTGIVSHGISNVSVINGLHSSGRRKDGAMLVPPLRKKPPPEKRMPIPLSHSKLMPRWDFFPFSSINLIRKVHVKMIVFILNSLQCHQDSRC